jgi:hypothetical protein
MADLFWRRRLRKQARQITLSLPNLPEDIDDNVFIALAAQAAEQDKKSGAYDEFMFSEDGYVSMPFEDSVDEFLALQIARTSERKGRAELPFKLRIEYLKSRVEHRRRLVEDQTQELAEIEERAKNFNTEVAADSETESPAPSKKRPADLTTRGSHVSKVLVGWLIFAIVGAIDAGVIFLSLLLIAPTLREAIFFALPAVGVQILFPHLVGKAIAARRREPSKRTQHTLIAGLVGASWLMYIAAMTILRMELLIKWYRETNLEEMPQLLQVATSIFSVFILVGLGAWVMIRAMQDNPDELKQSKIKFVFTNAKSKLRKSLKKLAKAEAAVAAEEKLLAEISAQWDNRAARYPEVGESAKSAYRRALVNQAGTPEFTTTYLPKDKFSLRRPKRD